jgi:hypothetical protein
MLFPTELKACECITLFQACEPEDNWNGYLTLRKKLDAEVNAGWMVATITNNIPTRFGENQKEEREGSMANWTYEVNWI